MENNKQSLYTKYRPQTFDQVIGQSVAKEILVNSIEKNKINHAYLFYGIRGTGKTTLARIFAKAINCEHKVNNNPCNECHVCKSINNGSSFDVIEIDAASNNGVDEIRTIKENTTFLTTTTNYKVYIIDEVHMLSKAAFNALLKTLEEPPRNTIFLLATTELHKIPQTVLSRTVVINLEVMSDNDIKEGLEVILKGENVNYEPDALDYIVMTSGGSLRDAISDLETTLLYNNELSTNNVLSALGLINKDDIRDMIINDVEKLINSIDQTDKDPRKLSLIILEVIMHLIRNGETKYVNVLNEIINAVNTIKDPLLLKISLKSIFYSVNVSRETLVESSVVSRETFPNTPVLQEVNVESVEKDTQNQEINTINETNKENEIVEKQEENSTISVDNKIENPPKIDKNELNIVTDYVNVNNYMYIIKNNNPEITNKVVNRWKYKDSYVSRLEYKNIMAALMSTEPLATTEKCIIVGFRDETLINEYKRLSLSQEYFDFIKELIGEYMFILPVNEQTWSKLRSSRDTFTLNENDTDINLKPEDFMHSKTQETIIKATSLFGEGNIDHE